MSRLTRDGTTEPVSRDQLLGADGDREIFIFPVQLTRSRVGGLTWLNFIPIVGVGKTRRALIGPL